MKLIDLTENTLISNLDNIFNKYVLNSSTSYEHLRPKVVSNNSINLNSFTNDALINKN